MTIRSGDRVTLVYVRHFEDRTVFNISRCEVTVERDLFETREKNRDNYAPRAFVIDVDQIIPGLGEAAVRISASGEVIMTVSPEDAYGEFDPDQIRTYGTETFEGIVDEVPKVDLHIHVENGLHGSMTVARDDEIGVDSNHELAGRTLVFDIEIVVVQ